MQAQPDLRLLTAMSGNPSQRAATEEEMLASLAAGNRAAAEQLVDATYSSIYGALFRLCGGQAELAADLTQETYRKAWKALASFDHRARFSTWLYRIAYNTFLNHIRRPVRLVPVDGSEREIRDPSPGPEELADRRESAARLRRAILELPETLRFTVTARFWAERSVEEIARSEQVSGAAIRKRLKKARRMLREMLVEEGR